MTPEEDLSGRNPSVDHIRIFVALYLHTFQMRRERNLMRKLKSVSFLLLVEHKRLINCFIHKMKKILISRYVTFDEETLSGVCRSLLQLYLTVMSMKWKKYLKVHRIQLQ